MDITLRAPLFYLADLMFNYITVDSEKSSISVNDRNSPFKNASFSDIENSTFSTTIANVPQILYFNFEFTSNLAFLHIFGIIMCLMCMLLFTTPTKSLLRFSCLFFPLTTTLFALTFIPQVFEFHIDVSVCIVYLLRCIFFSIITCFIFLHTKSERRTVSAMLALVCYLILSTLNIQNVQFHFAKYLLSAVLIFLSSSKKSFQTFLIKKQHYIGKPLIIFLAFCFIHTTSLLRSKAPEEGPITEDQWRELIVRILSTEGGVALRSFILISVLCVVSYGTHVALDRFLFSNSRSHSSAQYIRIYVISPVIFLAFYINREFWNLKREQQWFFVLTIVTLHFASMLTHFCKTIQLSISKKTKEPFTNRIYWLIVFSFVSAVCLFVLSSRFHIIGMIVFSSALYSAIVATFLMLTLRAACGLPYAETYNKLLKVRMVNIEFLMKSQMLCCLIFSMLWFGASEVVDLFVLVGALYYAFVLSEECREKGSPLVRAWKIVCYLPERRSSGNHVCLICNEAITSDFCVTPCSHCFHRDCVVTLLLAKFRCPHCQLSLTAHFKIQENVFPKSKSTFLERRIYLKKSESSV